MWYTTALPFTYSSVCDLQPAQGVVLALESPQEQFRATKTRLTPLAESAVRPTEKARTITPEELKDLKDKARADFRLRLLESVAGRPE